MYRLSAWVSCGAPLERSGRMAVDGGRRFLAPDVPPGHAAQRGEAGGGQSCFFSARRWPPLQTSCCLSPSFHLRRLAGGTCHIKFGLKLVQMLVASRARSCWGKEPGKYQIFRRGSFPPAGLAASRSRASPARSACSAWPAPMSYAKPPWREGDTKLVVESACSKCKAF